MNPSVRVLLLEDDPADARLVGQMLRRVKTTPFHVTVVSRLSEAVARLAEDAASFDVVLADLGVPDSTGIATLNGLTAAAPRLPVVVLTGNDDDAVALEALKRGAQDYLVKGIGDAFILSRVVRYAIERKLAEEALREARDTAEKAARAKTVFLAMMGHEIRTPLNGVLGMARLLLETPLDGSQRSYARTLVSSGELLLGLVNDVLDFARLDADGLTLEHEPFNIPETVEEVRMLLASRAAEKGLALTCRFFPGLGSDVVGDRMRLRQILYNLVGNAIKFTDTGSVTIIVEPRPDAGECQTLRFSVIDSGIGISTEVGRNLFTEFWQGESGAARRFAGAGLGLAICKRLATLMGGDIDYRSAPGQGSVFHVDLPLATLDPGPASADGASPPATRSRRVLLVDDNEVNREVAAGLLERRGHTVVCANDGFEGVAAARSGGFDLVLLDMRMPGMDGIETAQAIGALPGDPGRVPMYLVTANPVHEDERRWREAGIRGCIAKPFRVKDIGRLMAEIDGRDRSAAPVAEPEPQFPVLDLSGLMADMRDLGRDRMAGLVDLFRRSSSVDLQAIRTHAGGGACEQLAQVSHRMASAAASLHLKRLTAACRAVEDAARRGDAATATARAVELDGLWDASLTALIQALG